jgi:hypothetical protein
MDWACKAVYDVSVNAMGLAKRSNDDKGSFRRIIVVCILYD